MEDRFIKQVEVGKRGERSILLGNNSPGVNLCKTCLDSCFICIFFILFFSFLSIPLRYLVELLQSKYKAGSKVVGH